MLHAITHTKIRHKETIITNTTEFWINKTLGVLSKNKKNKTE